MKGRRASPSRALLALLGVVFASVPADARTLAIVPRIILRARPKAHLRPGEPGTLGHAIAEQEKRRRFKRAQEEGVLPERDPEGTCPPEMGNADARVCVDRWEATLEEVKDDGTTSPWPATSALDPSRRYRARSVPGVVPQGYISGSQAASACLASGKRLCDAVEWRVACAGGEGTVYPYGPQHRENVCNDHGHSPMYVYYPEVERGWHLVTNTQMNDPRLNVLDGTVAKAGAHAGCVNDWGLYDMVGNLHEWTADPNGTFQGGYYLDTRVNGEGCAYRTTAHDVDYHDYSTGFRCCKDLAPPSDD